MQSSIVITLLTLLLAPSTATKNTAKNAATSHLVTSSSASLTLQSKSFSSSSSISSSKNLCTKLYWYESPAMTKSDSTPSFLHGAALGRSTGGNVVAVSIGPGGAPFAHYLNPLTNQWTSKQTITTVSAEGATIGRTTTPAAGDSDADSGTDVFVLFGGQSKDGQYSKQVVKYQSDAGFIVLMNSNPTVAPEGRTSGTLTGIKANEEGNARFLLVGGVDDEKDFADVWMLTLDASGSGTTYTWTNVQSQENDVGFQPRYGHASTKGPTKDTKDTTAADVLIFGGCQSSTGTETKCFNDVWSILVTEGAGTAAGTTKITMKKINMKEDSNAASPIPIEDAVAFVDENKMYVYGGCSVVNGARVCHANVRMLTLSTKDGATWSVPETGNAVVGLSYGGTSVLKQEKDFFFLGGCPNGKSECPVLAQHLNVRGVCAGTCLNGGSITKEGVCQCAQDFSGKDCATKISSASSVDCPKGCSQHGKCEGGKCRCDMTFGGPGCEERVCSVEGAGDCSGHGSCRTEPGQESPMCVCAGSYHGVICSEMYCTPRDCGGVGTCNDKLGKCDCSPGYGGAGCEKEGMCLGNCTNHGKCVAEPASLSSDSTSQCQCYDGFSGASCENDDRCDEKFGGCGEKGKCVDSLCECDVGYAGVKCENKECPGGGGGCSNHGFCDSKTGTCTCHFGHVGDGCEDVLQCPNNCTSVKQGLCVSAGSADVTIGQCKCTKGYQGDDCSSIVCLKSFPHQFADKQEECGGDARGQCNGKNGKCLCHPAYGGFACEFACPSGKKFRSNEIHPSKNHLNMGRRTPIDLDVAQLDAALGACSGHGVCATTLGGDARCMCENGIEGDACDQESECKVANCTGNGVCFRGSCLCVPGFVGDGCEERIACKTSSESDEECSGHGQCQLGKCYCDVGWVNSESGGSSSSNIAECGVKVQCQDNCNGHGKCHNSECFCATGWSGKNCDVHASCLNKCSNHGVCFLDECVCEVGFSGKDCSAYDTSIITTECQGGCNGRGTCRFGECFCEPGFSGPNCQSRAGYECPKSQGVTCSGNGECLYNKCFCMPGFAGKACDEEAKCPEDCSGHGTCANGMCYCKPPFRGADCNSTLSCVDDCNSRGICLDGKCACVEGFKGETCSFGADVCPNECSGHGSCQIGRCFCDPSWSGKGCSNFLPADCPNDCSSAGICHNGKCVCEPGMIGEDCGTPMPCPEGCRKNGLCVRGVCWCRPGYSGHNCSDPSDGESNARYELSLAKEKRLDIASRKCPNQCSHNGICFDGECMCEAGYSGMDCAVVDVGNDSCQNGCGSFGGTKTPRGRCWLGKCFCYPGFQGSDCTEVLKLPCPTDEDLGSCSGHGECHYGRCFCDIGFAGKACSTPVGCAGDCSGHGSCHRGRCLCETGFMSENCNSTNYVCENNCNNNGVCILGACSCHPGWSGRACLSRATEFMEGKKEQARLTDTMATESLVNNPDAENLVNIHQASVDYVLPSGQSVIQNQKEKPNRIKISSDILPKVVEEKTNPTETMALVKKKSAANVVPSKGGAKTSMLLMIEESSSVKTTKTTTKTTSASLTCMPVDCSGRGRCHRGVCYCNPGYDGDGCEQLLECQGNNCNGHGDCANGQCVCEPGFSGTACEVIQKCPEKCNERGICRWGECYCDVGFSGSACEMQIDSKKCPAGCSGNGICEAGVCFCKAQYHGEDCSQPVDLHIAAKMWANLEHAKHKTTTFSGKSALGVATLCFVVGIGAATLLTTLKN